MTHNLGSSIEKARDGTLDEALRFTGEVLVVRYGKDGCATVKEYRKDLGERTYTKKNCIIERTLSNWQAHLLAESFQKSVNKIEGLKPFTITTNPP